MSVHETDGADLGRVPAPRKASDLDDVPAAASDPTPQELMRRIAADDRAAMRTLYGRYENALFDYFCDYLCFIVAPWSLTRVLVQADGDVADAILIVPLVTGAARYARSSVIVAGRDDEVRDLPGLATMFFAFVGVLAVFLDVRGAFAPAAATAIVLGMSLAMSILMIVPIRYPKLTAFRGVSPTVLALLVAMPIVGTRMIAAAAVVIGLAYVIGGPLLARMKPAEVP